MQDPNGGKSEIRLPTSYNSIKSKDETKTEVLCQCSPPWVSQ